MTDGSNASPTLVARANTGQTSQLFQISDASHEINFGGEDVRATDSLKFHAGVLWDGAVTGNGGSILLEAYSATELVADYSLLNNGSHAWTIFSGGFSVADMAFDATGKLAVSGTVDAAGTALRLCLESPHSDDRESRGQDDNDYGRFDHGIRIGREMKKTELQAVPDPAKTLPEKIAALKKALDNFIANANSQVARMQGKIEAFEELAQEEAKKDAD